jgi:hypothetical protein
MVLNPGRLLLLSGIPPIVQSFSLSEEKQIESWNGVWLISLMNKQLESVAAIDKPAGTYLSPFEEGMFDARHTTAQINRFRLRRYETGGPQPEEIASYLVRQRMQQTAVIGNDNRIDTG